jgi:hypothetical protein
MFMPLGKPMSVGLGALDIDRLDAMLSAARTLRPALQAFYNTLSDDQKSRFDAVRPGKGRGAGCHQ